MSRLDTRLATKIAIVDDDPAIRKSLMLLLQQAGMEVSTFDCGEAFLASDLTQRYGCAIVDLKMPGISGLALQESLTKLGIPLSVVILTGYGEISTSVAAIKSGAVDYLVKPVTSEKLISVIETAVAKTENGYGRVERQQKARLRLAELTQRELEIMHLAIQGLPDKVIAKNMKISHRTVEKHKSSMLHKTGSRNVLDLFALALECSEGADQRLETD